jgi:iron complex outermembrane receptor protein
MFADNHERVQRALLVVALSASSHLFAQSPVTGVVRDAQSAPVERAQVTLTSLEDGRSVRQTTGTEGRFEFPAVAGGWYGLTATKDGFRPFEQPRLSIAGPSSRTIEVRLEVGAVRTEINVLANSGLLTATRLDLPVRDTPVTGGSVPRSLIDEQGALTAAAVVRNISGAHVRVDYGLYENYTFRGYSGDRNNVLLVDGIRNEGNRVSTQLSHVDRVEVLKGPASVLYGNEAFGGAVNLIRKRPSAERQHEFGVSFGRWNDFRVTAGTTGALSRSVLYRLDFGVNRSDGWRDIQPRRLNATPVLYWYPTARQQLTVHYTFIRDRFAPDGGIPIFGGALAEVPFDRRLNTPNDFALSRDHNAQIGYTWEFAANHQIRNTLAVRRYQDEYFAAESYGFRPPGTITRSALYFLHDRPTVLNQLQYAGQARKGFTHRFIVGYEFQRFRNDTDRSNFLELTPLQLPALIDGEPARDRLPTARWIRFRQTIHAAYAQDHIEITPKLKALLGIRYDNFDRWSRTDPVVGGAVTLGPVIVRDLGELTGRAGVVYQVAPEYAIYGSHSTSFRPNLQVPADGRVLEPEYGNQSELGQRIESLSGRLAANIAVYQLVKRNVVFARIGNIFEQAGRVRSRGAEVDLEMRPARSTVVTANYAFTHTRFQDFFSGNVNLTGFRPQYVPRHTANLWATRFFGPVGIAAGAQYVGLLYSDNANLIRLGGFVLFDAAAFYRRGPWEVAFNLPNILNRKRYFNTSIYDTQLYPGAPIAPMISLRWRQ